jgi:ADP-heptose:LPS heptosyltransferase
MGYNQSIDNSIQLDMPCRPCSIFGQKACQRGDYACMNDIDPEMIIKKMESFLQ